MPVTKINLANIVCLIVLLSFIQHSAMSQAVPAATIQSVSPGSWTVASNWSTNAVPGPNDHVSIRHNISLSSTAEVASISVLNSVANATLTVSGSLSVTEGSDYAISVIGSQSNDSRLIVDNGGSVTASNLGPVLYSRTCNCSMSIKIEVRAGGTLIGGNLYGLYSTNATNESTDEIQIFGTATFSSVHLQLDIGNSFNFIMDVLGDGDLTINGNVLLEPINGGLDSDVLFLVGNVSTDNATCHILGDLELRLNSSSTNPDDVRVRVFGSSRLTVDGRIFFNHNSDVEGEDADVELYNNASLDCGSILARSELNSSSRNNRAELNDDSYVLVRGDVTFDSFSTTHAERRLANAVELSNNSTLELKGNVRNSLGVISTNEGRINPLSGSCWILFTGATQQTVPDTYSNTSPTSNTTADYDGTYYNILLQNTSGQPLLLEDDVIIEEQFSIIECILQSTSTNILTFENGVASNSGNDNAFIDGRVVKKGTSALLLPIGDVVAGVNYWAPLSFNSYTGGSSSSSFQVEYNGTSHSSTGSLHSSGPDHVSQKEYWLFDFISGASVTELNISLYWKKGCFSRINSVNDGDLFISRFNGSAPTPLWTLINTDTHTIDVGSQPCDASDGDSDIGSISADLNTFGTITAVTFGAPNANNPLPVTLQEFNGNVRDGAVVLDWVTATEVNNDFFSIERAATQELNFLEMGTLDGAGTTMTEQRYTFRDLHPEPGTMYYRLKQVDFDGACHYSSAIAVRVNENAFDAIVYPNPAQNKLFFTSSFSGEMRDSRMIVIRRLNDVRILDVSAFVPGIYWFRDVQGKITRVVINN
jgi:hypothetical protein